MRAKRIGRTRRIALALSVIAAATASAAVTEQEAAKLGKELTPVGAERAGNKDATIPEWSGGMTTAPAGWKAGQKRVDPYAADKPLFSIDASNVDKYRDKLSEGQVALVKQIKGYRMDVYPTHRSCGFPDFVYERTRTNATTAQLASNGWGLEKGIGAAVLFPMPKTGAEAVWNHKVRYMGEGRIEHYATIFSAKGGDFTPLVQDQWTWVPVHSPKNKGVEEVNGVEMKLLNEVLSPPAHAGELILAHWFFNNPSDAWLYFPGQRRVRRAPTFAYDNPVPGYENLETVDAYPMYAGAMDRYDWKLVGKREMYMPYNSYRLSDTKLKYGDVLKPGHINQDLARYELHRVWVVEATLKPGTSHIYAKRTFYIDEDSWAILATDKYDGRGELWRFAENHNENWYNVPMWFGTLEVHNDLQSGRYIAMGLRNEETKIYEPIKRTAGDYTPSNLRGVGTR